MSSPFLGDNPGGLVRAGYGPDTDARLPRSGILTPSFTTVAWAFVGGLALIDILGARLAGISFAGWRTVFMAVGFLAAVGFAYDYSGRNRQLADVGTYASLWVGFSTVGSVFTYVAATLRMPLCDTHLAGIDAALGFHWGSWFYLVSKYRLVRIPLGLAYASMLPQIIFSILYFAHTRQTTRNRELLSLAMISLLVTTAISAILPAVGPFIPGHQPEFAKMLVAIRSGSVTAFSLDNMQGIVTMPSYHTVIAIVLVWVHRPPSRSFPMIAALNVLMLLSVPSIGNHYLCDMLAGAAIALLPIALLARAFPPTPDEEPSTALLR